MRRLGWLLLLASGTAFGQLPSPREKEERFGAAMAPATLPPASTAWYGYLGVPELAAGYRQGLAIGEWEARVRLDYLRVALLGEAIAKWPWRRGGPLQLAPSLGAGLVYDTGARLTDPANFQHLGLVLTPGLQASYRVAERLELLGSVELPWDLPLAPGGGGRVSPFVLGGGELSIGDDLTVLGAVKLGIEWVKEPMGVTQTRFTWGVRVGIGHRLF